MLRLCVAGAAGKMGSTILREAVNKGFQIVGAVVSPHNVNILKSLREAGICESDVKLMGPSNLKKAIEKADVYISFTTPAAEAHNLPIVADVGKKIVMGTTGFTKEQMRKIQNAVSSKVPAVFSPNFALGVNILFRLTQVCKSFPPEYDFSIMEAHHTGKRDAPSGTAKKLGEIVSSIRDYSKVIHGREGLSPRIPEELEILSVRTGGVIGMHNLIIAGPYEMVRIEHVAFSRSVFAQGALYA
ncbi:4-hydroxy-tetrahydrodipicolinate reductase, partial [Candidatus Bathyarchaeota archaeon]|nr:4-hydroxy-tetrahydrodipicolinate reductase [Candidatus Bathyarchaeota archaeon]